MSLTALFKQPYSHAKWPSRTIPALAMILVALAAFAPPVAAQMRCASRDSLIEYLSTEYDEVPSARGLMSADLMMELFTSDSGSWTIVITRPIGVSCIIGSGEDWEQMLKDEPLAEQSDGMPDGLAMAPGNHF